MNYWMGVATLTGIYMIAILGVSILTGFTGLFSMGHAGFMAIGAYTSALITKTFHVPILVGVFCGMLTALVIGLIIGYPTLKLKGDYFVIATLGIGEVTKLIIENMPNLTGGARGLTDVPKGATFPVVLCFLVVIVWGLRNFLRSKQDVYKRQGGQPVDLLSLKKHLALRGIVHPGNHVEQRGLARPVGPDDAVDAAPGHIDGYIVGSRDAAKALHDIL